MSKEVWGYHEHPKRREPEWVVHPQTSAVREGLARSGFGETSEALYLNSGFTYREYDYLNNARQVPKLPDWAVIDIRTQPNARWPGRITDADFFDEQWGVKKTRPILDQE